MIRHRTKTLIRTGLAGALIAAIPLSALLYTKVSDLKTTRESLAYYESIQEQTTYLTVCVLNQDVAAGEQLADSLISKQTISVTGEHRFLTADSGTLTGCRAKLSLPAGTILSKELVYAGDEITDDLRTIELSNIAMPEKLAIDDFVDIRISFPDGEDYIVTAQKRVHDLLTDEDETFGFVLRLGEEDILRVQSAAVDVNRYEGTRIYAVRYVSDLQSSPTEFYPVNDAVFALLQWDPNIADLFMVPEEAARRSVLEENIKGYLTDDSAQPGDETENERTQTIDEALELYASTGSEISDGQTETIPTDWR